MVESYGRNRRSRVRKRIVITLGQACAVQKCLFCANLTRFRLRAFFPRKRNRALSLPHTFRHARSPFPLSKKRAKNCKRQSSKNVKGGAHRISEAKTDRLSVFDCFLLGLLGTAGGESLSIITLAQKSIRERPKKASVFFLLLIVPEVMIPKWLWSLNSIPSLVPLCFYR